MQLKIKQVTGGDTFVVEAEPDSTVAELKEAVGQKANAEASGLRLIYKGQILKEDRTLLSYGLENDHVVHMVKGKQQQGAAARSGATGAAAAASGASSAAAAAPTAAAVDPLAQAMGGLGFSGGGAGSQADMMQQALQSPMMQALLRNPELMRTMLQANPAVRQMIEANPEVGRMLTDPDTLRQMTQIMSNPALMREQVRNMDRAMSNIESMPGGFNALRQFHSAMQPLEEAAGEGPGAAAAADNPFAALFQPGGGAGGSAGGSAGSGSGAQQPAGAPNEAPLPNPWSAGGGAGGAGAGGAAAGLGGMGGLDPQQLLANPEMRAAMEQMMADPGMQQLMQQQMEQLLSSPEGQAQMQAMLESNPMYQSALASNPAMADHMRSMFTDPQRMRAMLDPRTQHAMQQMAQAMQELQNTGLFPELPAGLGGLGLGAAPGGAAGAGAGAGAAGGAPNLGNLMGMLGMGVGDLGGLGGLGAFGVPPPPANPEEAYATQLQQLQDMGFYDREANIRALVAAGGNVNVAVERLLATM